MLLEEKKPLLLSVKSDILDYVLFKVKNITDDMTKYAISQYESKFNQVDAFEEEWIRLHVERDIINSFERWTKSSDTLKGFEVEGNIRHVLTISAIVERNNIDHKLSMNIIWGGFTHNLNIFNYFAKSTLNQTFRTDHLDSYNSKINDMLFKREFESKLYFKELNINRIKCNILMSETKSDQDIINNQKKLWKDLISFSWQEAISSGFDVTYESEKEFNMIKVLAPKKAIQIYKYHKIEKPKKKVLELETELNGLRLEYISLFL